MVEKCFKPVIALLIAILLITSTHLDCINIQFLNFSVTCIACTKIENFHVIQLFVVIVLST